MSAVSAAVSAGRVKAASIAVCSDSMPLPAGGTGRKKFAAKYSPPYRRIFSARMFCSGISHLVAAAIKISLCLTISKISISSAHDGFDNIDTEYNELSGVYRLNGRILRQLFKYVFEAVGGKSPAQSKMAQLQCGSFKMPVSTSRVVAVLPETMLRCWPSRALSRLLLPAFGAPTMPTAGKLIISSQLTLPSRSCRRGWRIRRFASIASIVLDKFNIFAGKIKPCLDAADKVEQLS